MNQTSLTVFCCCVTLTNRKMCLYCFEVLFFFHYNQFRPQAYSSAKYDVFCCGAVDTPVARPGSTVRVFEYDVASISVAECRLWTECHEHHSNTTGCGKINWRSMHMFTSEILDLLFSFKIRFLNDLIWFCWEYPLVEVLLHSEIKK